MKTRKILVTAALPYANGQIHLGHLVEYIQADVWVRFQKLRGERCIYICADDTHGTAIMIAANKGGIAPEEFIARMSESHQHDFADFGIQFDHYGSTNSADNRKICNEIWGAIRAAGLVEQRDVSQLYDITAQTFLADRFVKGTCPKCGRKEQYGDSCECGAAYSPTELIAPISTLSDTTPELRTAPHLFVEIEKLHPFLDEWVTQSGSLQEEMSNYLKGQFLGNELHAWDVSRPAPYFGFEIPDSPGNYWYVWFDAPIGYIGTTLQWCEQQGESLDSWWRSDSAEIHHFIGKDICYFHTLFWPAMLKTAGFSLPTKVHIHGFLTVGGEKMSKSRGTFIMARTYLNHLNPDYLRYFYSTKTSSRIDDLDLNLDEFEAKVNADLVGNIVNIASRTAKFANLTGMADCYPDDGGLFAQAAGQSEEIAGAFEQRDFGKAIRMILECGFRANQYIEKNAPWSIRKELATLDKQPEPDPAQRAVLWQKLQDVVTVSLNLFRQIIIYLSPILPELAAKSEKLLNMKITGWDDLHRPLLGTQVNEYEHLMTRVPREGIEKMTEESKIQETAVAESQTDRWNDSAQPLLDEPLAPTISIEDFQKVDLRIGRIIDAEEVKEARKLLKLKISLGGDETRQVFAGIKAAYPEPEKLVGRMVVIVANLAPRQMKFGLSEGMVVAAGPGGTEVFVISPDPGAQVGQRLH